MGNGHRVQFNVDPDHPRILARIEEVLLPKRSRRRVG
jgi:hypothetical protein